MKSFSIFCIMFLFTSVSYGQANKPVDYLGASAPISFDNSMYNLAWTSHPATNYYKQEYFKKGDTMTKFRSMILLELLTGATKIKDVIGNKVAELKSMKAANPFISYETFGNAEKGEYILDFLVTENEPDGKTARIAERNIYRYKTFVGKNGESGVLLFGVSVRSYGNETTKFIEALQSNRNVLVDKVKEVRIPAIAIRK